MRLCVGECVCVRVCALCACVSTLCVVGDSVRLRFAITVLCETHEKSRELKDDSKEQMKCAHRGEERANREQ
jgi:hypothetical protein